MMCVTFFFKKLKNIWYTEIFESSSYKNPVNLYVLILGNCTKVCLLSRQNALKQKQVYGAREHSEQVRIEQNGWRGVNV